MRALIRALSPRTEALIVVLGSLGIFLTSSIAALLDPSAIASVSESGLRSLLVYEPIALCLFGAFLHVRGWTPARLGLSLQRTDAALGVLIGIAAYAAIVFVWLLLESLGVHTTSLHGAELVDRDITLVSAIAASVVNALFEELFVCGYLISVAKEHGRMTMGVNLSVAIRLAYHLYQGGEAVVGILPFGLICAWWFARTGRLFPVVIAHALIDLTALLQVIG